MNLCIVTDQRGARHHQDCEALFAHTVWQNPRFRNLGITPEPLEPLEGAHPLQASMSIPARNGVFLAGDALRVMEPFTGQGIFFALRTGELAAEAITRGIVATISERHVGRFLKSGRDQAAPQSLLA